MKATDLSPGTNVCPCLLRVLCTVLVQHMHLLYALYVYEEPVQLIQMYIHVQIASLHLYILFKHFISVMLASSTTYTMGIRRHKDDVLGMLNIFLNIIIIIICCMHGNSYHKSCNLIMYFT